MSSTDSCPLGTAANQGGTKIKTMQTDAGDRACCCKTAASSPQKSYNCRPTGNCQAPPPSGQGGTVVSDDSSTCGGSCTAQQECCET